MLGSNVNVARKENPLLFCQSFASATALFNAIDAPTRAVLVPWGEEGADLIASLCSTEVFHRRKEMLRKGQRYAVNIYDNTYRKLMDQSAFYDIQESGMLALRDTFYDKELGIITEPTAPLRIHCY